MAVMTRENQLKFMADVLKKLGLEPTYNRLLWLMAQAQVENTKAQYNPLATTWNMESVDPGQTRFNSAGVRNYSNWAVGVQATANTLKQLAYYPYSYSQLKADTSPTSPLLDGARLQREYKTYGGTSGYWNTLLSWAKNTQLADFVKKKSSQKLAGLGLLLLGCGLIYWGLRKS